MCVCVFSEFCRLFQANTQIQTSLYVVSSADPSRSTSQVKCTLQVDIS